MPMNYKKLFILMNEKGVTSYKIRKDRIITETTLQRLRQNENVTTDALCKLCSLLHCQPGDIMEYVPDDEA